MVLSPFHSKHGRIPCVITAPICETRAIPRLIWYEFDFLNYMFVITGDDRDFIHNPAEHEPWATILVLKLHLFSKTSVGSKLLPLGASDFPDVPHVQPIDI